MTRFLFISGKGGVGKTSLAAATAVYHADQGRRTLIVTTDPASNLADVFMQSISSSVVPISAVRNLEALEINASQAASEYRDRVLEPLRAVMPEAVLDVVADQLNSPCTDEIASFDRFVACMEQPEYDVVVFDTAPTGHTLRMLELPVDWSRHITQAEQGPGQRSPGSSSSAETTGLPGLIPDMGVPYLIRSNCRWKNRMWYRSNHRWGQPSCY